MRERRLIFGYALVSALLVAALAHAAALQQALAPLSLSEAQQAAAERAVTHLAASTRTSAAVWRAETVPLVIEFEPGHLCVDLRQAIKRSDESLPVRPTLDLRSDARCDGVQHPSGSEPGRRRVG